MGRSKDIATSAKGDADYVNVSGDTMTGNLTVSGGVVSATGTSTLTNPDADLGLYHSFRNLSANINTGVGVSLGSNNNPGATIWAQRTGANNEHRLGFNPRNNSGSSVTRMAIDGAGRVTMPYQPAFHVGRNSNYTPGSGNAILFNGTGSASHHFNRGGHYSTSTGRFTAPVAGVYHFSTCIIWGNGITDGQNMADSFHIYKNNSLAVYSMRRAEYVNGYTGNDGYYTDFGNATLDLAANDYVFVRASSGVQVHGNDRYTWFNGFLVG